MAILSDEIKLFIVRELAMYGSPQTVADLVSQEFGVEVSRAQVAKYDPAGSESHKLAAKWKSIYESTRAAFLKETGTIGVAQRAVRLRGMDRMAQEAMRRRNYPLVLQIYEQAAKESGGQYTNNLNVRHSGHVSHSVTAEEAAEAKAEMEMLLAKARGDAHTRH